MAIIPFNSYQRETTQDKKRISRREFLLKASLVGAFLSGGSFALTFPPWPKYLSNYSWASLVPSSSNNAFIKNAPLARYWISSNSDNISCVSCHKTSNKDERGTYDHEENIVKCLLCAQECIIKEGKRGECRTRININGRLRTLVYGHPISVHVDPIEKKPFYHFLPGAQAFSLATAGCPLHCKFCQNWEISQARPEDFSSRFISPEAVALAAKRKNAPVIAYTYNEPTVFTEYLTDIARIARKDNIASVLVSCGFMNKAPLDEMCSVLDAIKIDLKGFSRDFYRRVCSAELEPVLRSIKQVSQSGCHLEIVNLVVPTLNDSKQMLTDLTKWIVGEIGQDVPVHFTRFHPNYQMLNLPPTPVATLEQAYEIAKTNGIHYPYVGNVPGHPGNNTYCPSCGKMIISRTGFFVISTKLKNGHCKYCNEHIAGVWNRTQ